MDLSFGRKWDPVVDFTLALIARCVDGAMALFAEK
jgi:hypothetical protein